MLCLDTTFGPCAVHRVRQPGSVPVTARPTQPRHGVRARSTGQQPLVSSPGLPQDQLELMQELGKVPGIRVVVQADVPSEDEESWEDMLDELDNPWSTAPAAESAMEEAGISAAPGSASAESAYVSTEQVQEVSYSELRELLAQHPTAALIDVRDPQDFAARHVTGSTNIPIKQLTSDAAQALKTRSCVIVVGSGDYRGAQACVRLTRVHHLPRVYYYEGGSLEWEQQQ